MSRAHSLLAIRLRQIAGAPFDRNLVNPRIGAAVLDTLVSPPPPPAAFV
jgi:hypothetical protein